MSLADIKDFEERLDEILYKFDFEGKHETFTKKINFSKEEDGEE
jgi:hypothetical protein